MFADVPGADLQGVHVPLKPAPTILFLSSWEAEWGMEHDMSPLPNRIPVSAPVSVMWHHLSMYRAIMMDRENKSNYFAWFFSVRLIGISDILIFSRISNHLPSSTASLNLWIASSSRPCRSSCLGLLFSWLIVGSNKSEASALRQMPVQSVCCLNVSKGIGYLNEALLWGSIMFSPFSSLGGPVLTVCEFFF